MSEHGALAGLGPAEHALVPELAAIAWPEESAATCSDCVMASPHPDREVFLEEARCCTFFPRLVNFKVGRVLQAGGAGAAVMRGLLGAGASVMALGVQPGPEWMAQYFAVGPGGFGHTLALRCPYWVGGELACGVWSERNHVCRTWFCKHDEGQQGQDLWDGLRDVLGRADRVLADALVAGGEPPEDSEDPALWEAWFLGCAERLDGLDTAGLADDPKLADLRQKLRDADAARGGALPDVLAPSLMKWEVRPEGGWVYSYSPYDECPVPGDIWQLLSRLDGERTWQQAVAETRAAGFSADEPLIRALVRIGALEHRDPRHTEPGLARVKLQEADGRWTHMGMVALERGD